MTMWQKNRKTPYTELGIQRLKCIRCGDQAVSQWQICADRNNYRPICGRCDEELNRTVLQFMSHPNADGLMMEYINT